MSLPRDGVSFVAEGADKFIADLNRVGISYNETTGRFRDASGKFVSANNAMAGAAGAVEQQATGFVGATDMMSGGLSILDGVTLQAGKALFDFAVSVPKMVIDGLIGIGKAVWNVGEAIGGLATEAAQLQGVAAGLGNFAAQTELGAEAILASLKAASSGMVSTQDLMTKFNDAAALVSVQFAERLPEGLEILGKVSAATGTDLNYLLDSFVTGIGRVSPAILDNLKIQVSSAEATARAAEMFGKEEDALSKVEQQMALTEITLEKLTEKFGGLPDVTQSATANLARIDAMFADIRAQIGSAFLPAWTAATNAVANAVGFFSDLISEGGALFPVLANIGAAASLMAEGFESGVLNIINLVDDMQTSISTSLSSTAENALSWGTNIAVSFAQGLIDGAATALTVAMNFISGMLSGWLAPGSPPKVAPDLPKWGLSAMTQFLEGFEQADFGMLKSLQAPLSKVLEDTDFADISQTIAGAISAGEVDEGLFDTIAASAGEFGTEIADLARLEWELATSTEAVAQAQNDLAASGQAVSDSQAKVAGLTAEYNQLLRSGATEEQLDAQLALINAAEKQRDAAIGQNAANQTALSSAEDAATVDKDRVANQKDLVDQLISLSQAERDAADAAASGAGVGAGAAGLKLPGAVGGAGVAIPALDTMLPDVGALGAAFDFTGGLETAIDAAKLTIEEKFGSIFDPIKAIIAEKFGPGSAIGQQWGTISEQIKSVWDTKLVPFWENTLVPAVNTAVEAFGNMQTFWEESEIPRMAGEAFGEFLRISTELAENVIPFFAKSLLRVSEWFVENGPLIDEAVASFGENWDTTGNIFVEMWDIVEEILDGLLETILNLVELTLQIITGDWDEAWNTAGEIVNDIAFAMGEAFVEFLDLITKLLGGESWQAVKDMWANNWDNLLLIVSLVGLDVIVAVGEIVDNITAWFGEQNEIFAQWGSDMIGGFIGGIKSMAGSLADAASSVVEGAINIVEEVLGIDSPSKLFKGFGEDTVLGYAEGILDSENLLTNAMNTAFSPDTMQPLVQPTMMGAMDAAQTQPIMREVSISIGPNYFQSGDAQQLRRTIQQVLRAELRRN